jgi:hypothetical protein
MNIVSVKLLYVWLQLWCYTLLSIMCVWFWSWHTYEMHSVFLVKSSVTSGCNWTCWIMFQRRTKEARCSLFMPLLMSRSRIQLLLVRASWIERFFFHEISKSKGAMSFGRRPCSQPESQKDVFFPSPMEIVVHAAKSCLSLSAQGSSVLAQGLSVEVHWCQSHLSLSALANLSRLGMPNPPHSFGR